MSIREKWCVSDNCMGRLLSMSMLLMSGMCYYFNYSTLLLYGCMTQYIFSTLIWIPPAHPIVYWGDRTFSVINMVMVSREYHARGATYSCMWLLLLYTISFKIIDNIRRINDEVTWYYVGWHVNLVGLNYGIMIYVFLYGTNDIPPPMSLYKEGVYIGMGLGTMYVLNCNSMCNRKKIKNIKL